MNLDPLTLREAQVLQLLARQDDTEWVADQMGITYNTVRQHLRNINSKLETTTRMEAVLWASNRGIITTDPSKKSPLGRLT